MTSREKLLLQAAMEQGNGTFRFYYVAKRFNELLREENPNAERVEEHNLKYAWNKLIRRGMIHDAGNEGAPVNSWRTRRYGENWNDQRIHMYRVADPRDIVAARLTPEVRRKAEKHEVRYEFCDRPDRPDMFVRYFRDSSYHRCVAVHVDGEFVGNVIYEHEYKGYGDKFKKCFAFVGLTCDRWDDKRAELQKHPFFRSVSKYASFESLHRALVTGKVAAKKAKKKEGYIYESY